MLNGLIGFSLKNRFVILLLTGILVALGVRAGLRLPLDALGPSRNKFQVSLVPYQFRSTVRGPMV